MAATDALSLKCAHLKTNLLVLTQSLQSSRQSPDTSCRMDPQFSGRYLVPHIQNDSENTSQVGFRSKEVSIDRDPFYQLKTEQDRSKVLESLLSQKEEVLTETNHMLQDLVQALQIQVLNTSNGKKEDSGEEQRKLMEVRVRLLEEQNSKLLDEILEMKTQISVNETEKKKVLMEKRRLETKISDLQSRFDAREDEIIVLQREKVALTQAVFDEKKKAEALQKRLSPGCKEESASAQVLKIQELEGELARLNKEREMLVQTFEKYPHLDETYLSKPPSSRHSSPKKVYRSLRSEKTQHIAKETVQKLAEVLETTVDEVLSVAKQMKIQMRGLTKFYGKLKSLVADCSLTQELDMKQVYKWVQKLVEDYMNVKLTGKEERAFIQEAMKVLHSPTPQVAIQSLRRLLPSLRNDSEKMSTCLSLSDASD